MSAPDGEGTSDVFLPGFHEPSTPKLWNLTGQGGFRLGFRVIVGFSEFVTNLLQEPVLSPSLSHSGSYECPLSPKFPAKQGDSYDAIYERDGRVGSRRSDHLIFAKVPHDDFARAIFSVRQGSLEQKVVDRVVRNMDREAPYVGIFTWALRHRPRDEDGANFQSEVIVEAPSPMFLDPESVSRALGPRSRFGYDWRGHVDNPVGASGICSN